jgi:hypothetical protein
MDLVDRRVDAAAVRAAAEHIWYMRLYGELGLGVEVDLVRRHS